MDFKMHISQHEVYFDQILNPNNPKYNLGGYVELKGSFNREVMIEAIQTLPIVFDSLRFKLSIIDHEPKCVFANSIAELKIDEIDFSKEENSAEKAKAWMQGRFNEAFSLELDVLYEIALLKIDKDQYWYYMKCHHLITDGYGYTILMQYLSNKYSSLVNKTRFEFAIELYQNEILKSLKYFESDSYLKDLLYWKNKFESKLKVSSYIKSGIQSNRISRIISPHTKTLIEDSLFKTKASLQQLTISALGIYYARLKNTDVITVGVPIHKRRDKRQRNTVGMFSGVLPFIGFYQADKSLEEHINLIIAQQRSDYRHQDFPISHMYKELNLQTKDLLYDFVVNYEPFNFNLNFQDLIAETKHLSSSYENIPLKIRWCDYGKNQPLELHVDFQLDNFSENEVNLMIDRILHLMESTALNLSKRVDEITILSEQECEKVLKLSYKDKKYSLEKTFLDYFNEQVALRPDNVVINFNDSIYTFKDIDRESDKLKNYLNSIISKENVLIGIYLENPIEIIICFVSVIKSGNVFIFIDPKVSETYIDYVIEDSQMDIMIMHSSNAVNSRSKGFVQNVFIDNYNEGLTVNSKKDSLRSIHLDYDGYVFYSQEINETPIGIVFDHGSMKNQILDQIQNYSIKDDSCILHISNEISEIPIWNFLVPFLSGASIKMYSQSQMDSQCLVQKILDGSHTHVKTSFSFFNHLSIESIADLNIILFSKSRETHQLKKRNDFKFSQINYEILGLNLNLDFEDSDFKLQKNVSTIKSYSQNDNFYILDDYLNILPIGHIGRLFIGGNKIPKNSINCLKSGLFNVDFIIDSPVIIEEKKLLKTSFLGTRLENGDIEFFGIDKTILKKTFELKKNQNIADLIDFQSQKNGNKTALSDSKYSISYKELESLSSSIAGLIQNEGITLGDSVVVFGKRDVFLPISLMGVVKSGGVFTIFSKRFPINLLKKLLTIINPLLIIDLDSDFYVDEINEFSQRNLIKIVQLGCSKENLIQNVLNHNTYTKYDTTDDKILYQIFTSGTTGNPKLVVSYEKAVLNYIEWQKKEFGISGNDKFSMFSGLQHDPLMRDIFVPLSVGAELCIPEDNLIGSLELFKWIKKNEVSIINLTPSLSKTIFYQVIDRLKKMRLAFFAGEALNEKVLRDFYSGTAGAKAVNLYGSTETQQALAYQIMNPLEHTGDEISLGKGILATDIVVLTDKYRIADYGEIGEIGIRSPFLSKGYKNDLQLTEKKFITNPYTLNEKDRIYLTGDLGRYSNFGEIHYCGRADDQIKIRGYRIELREVESVFLKCDCIQQCVVLVKEDSKRGNYLISYVVANKDFDAKKLKKEISQYLMDYMIPYKIVNLESFPLTENGKINKKVLSGLELENTLKEFVLPSNAVESKLLEIWKELLGLDQISTDDNFFDLGGHSLIATRVVSKVKKEFSVELEIMSLFSYSTIISLAKIIIEKEKDQTACLPQLVRKKDKPQRIPLSFSQERIWFIDRLQGSIAYHIPAVFRLYGKVNLSDLEYCFNEIVNRHEILRTVYKEEDGIGYQEVISKDCWKLDYDNSLGKELDDDSFVNEIINKPFDLSKDHSLRIHIRDFGENDYLLIFVMHHIGSDGWSMPIFVDEFLSLYRAVIKGQRLTLDELPIQYSDYSIWQRENMSGDFLKKKLDYWVTKLSGASELNLPTDYPRPLIQSSRGKSIKFRIESELKEQLEDLSKREGVTMFMLLLSVFKVLLYRYSGQEDICIGTPIANRTQSEIESLIGFFVNTIVLRSDLSDNPSFTNFLAQVKATTIDAYEHQEVPFERIVNSIEYERDLSKNALFQIMFVYQNNVEIQNLELEKEIDLKVQPFENKSSKFDISLFFAEEGGFLVGKVVYRTDFFHLRRINNMVSDFLNLIKSVVENPTEVISSLNFLSDCDELLSKNEIMDFFND
jgi:amino acid adenylation domain-containing protein